MRRPALLCSVALLLVPLLCAKDKNKAILPADVLRAQTVAVVIEPGAGEPLTDPGANRGAQEAVENALMTWGRFRLAMDVRTADLVIAVRRGSPRGTPTIGGRTIDDRPVILQPGEGRGPGDEVGDERAEGVVRDAPHVAGRAYQMQSNVARQRTDSSACGGRVRATQGRTLCCLC